MKKWMKRVCRGAGDYKFILKNVNKACPRRLVIESIKSILDYLNWIFYSVFFLKIILELLMQNDIATTIILYLCISSMIFGIQRLFEQWYINYYKPNSDVVLFKYFNEMVFTQACRVELECYENPEFYNKYTVVIKDIESRIVSVIESFTGVIFGGIASVIVTLYMYKLDHYVIIFIIFPFLGTFFFGKLHNNILFSRMQEGVVFQRYKDYTIRTVFLADYAKEIRMSNIFDVLWKNYERGKDGLVKITKKYAFKSITLRTLRNVFTFALIFMGVTIYSVVKTMIYKNMPINVFIILTSAMVSAAWILIGLSENVIKIVENTLYIGNLNSFLNYVPKIDENQNGIELNTDDLEIEFKNVSFSYANKAQKVLDNISIKFKSGEKIAIVGINGAGKSTFLKLLMRLYDPDDGEILCNGINIRSYNIRSYRSKISVAFQDFEMFAMPLIKNIMMKDKIEKGDYRDALELLKQCGMYDKITNLPYGLDTVMTKEFLKDGAVLSGGEKQKIAIIRTYLSNAAICIYDEPTSALDPISEENIFDIINQRKDNITIYISHRLSATKTADRIYLLENGRITEEGIHSDLMNMQGKYYTMFSTQAKKYMNGEDISE